MISPGGRPEVVWLTRDRDPDHNRGWARGSDPKTRARFELDVPKPFLMSWRKFMAQYNVPYWWVSALAEAGGNPSAWLVSRGVVKRDRWRALTVFGDDSERTYEGKDLERLRLVRDGDEYVLRVAAEEAT